MKPLIGILVTAIVILAAALAFVLGRQSAQEPTAAARITPAAVPSPPRPSPPITPTPTAIPTRMQEQTKTTPFTVANAEELTPLPGAKSFTETFDDITLKFLPTKSFRKMIEYRLNNQTDSSCTKVYSARERVTKVNYAYGFVIESFNTWNAGEGQQEYMTAEETLPNAFKGSLHDIVRQGRSVLITKQRCGMGQVEGLIAVKP